ncbi:hypothetical protein N0V82_008460 [Gnomoniopsis sp. IMI 355080]|nr:hypothetical protein N0V82_008460 [Gnomoniopsis sp. IMI 355080]
MANDLPKRKDYATESAFMQALIDHAIAESNGKPTGHGCEDLMLTRALREAINTLSQTCLEFDVDDEDTVRAWVAAGKNALSIRDSVRKSNPPPKKGGSVSYAVQMRSLRDNPALRFRCSTGANSLIDPRRGGPENTIVETQKDLLKEVNETNHLLRERRRVGDENLSQLFSCSIAATRRCWYLR